MKAEDTKYKEEIRNKEIVFQLREAYKRGFNQYLLYTKSVDQDKRVIEVASMMLYTVSGILQAIDNGSKVEIRIGVFNTFIITMNELISIAKAFIASGSHKVVDKIKYYARERN